MSNAVVADVTATTLLTPYGAAKIVNALLAEAGVAKVLPPQMFYTYVKKGYIPSTDKKIAAVDLAAWAEKYIAKHITPAVETPAEA
jgi:hypothetical protein